MPLDAHAQGAPELLETIELIRTEGELLREHVSLCLERVGHSIDALIDAIELMKYIDSEPRQHGTGLAD